MLEFNNMPLGVLGINKDQTTNGFNFMRSYIPQHRSPMPEHSFQSGGYVIDFKSDVGKAYPISGR